MKKFVFPLFALMALLLASCSTTTERYSSLADEIKSDGNSWDAETWEKKITSKLTLECEFVESQPTRDDYLDFSKVQKRMTRNIDRLKSKAQARMEKAQKRVLRSDRDLQRRVKKATRKFDRLEDKYSSRRSRSTDDYDEYDDEEIECEEDVAFGDDDDDVDY